MIMTAQRERKAAKSLEDGHVLHTKQSRVHSHIRADGAILRAKKGPISVQ